MLEKLDEIWEDRDWEVKAEKLLLKADGKLPEDLRRPAVIEISLTSLVAGTKYRGEFVGAVLLPEQGNYI